MELRRILYGYKKEQFNYLIEPNEAEIVREIFSDYVNGKSLVEIANSLTEKGIVYFKDKTVWTKNAVKRILENAHYMGDNEYQKIVEKETFESAEMVKLSKGGGKRETDSKEIKYLKQYCVCEKCGKRFTRMSKYKTRERWYCSGGCSYTKKYLDDITLNTMIEEIISSVKVNPDLLNTNDTQNIVLSQELLKKERNIKYLMSQSEPSFLPVQKLLYECVSDKFNELIMGTSAEVTDELKKYIVMYESKKKTLDVEFIVINKKISDPSFSLTVKIWKHFTNATGIISKQGNGGGTYAHIDIAIDFYIWTFPDKRYELIRMISGKASFLEKIKGELEIIKV